MATIILAGAGNIGLRHFDGLLKIEKPLTIHVLDPSAAALDRIKECFSHKYSSNKQCYYHQVIDTLPNHADVILVATGAKVRFSLTEKLLKKVSVPFLILEKVLFQNLNDYDIMSELMKQYHIKGCWVNCPLRIYPFYRELKDSIEGPAHITIDYKHFGIGCNSIHYLDLFSFLTGNLEIHVDSECLTDIVASKRDGYMEVKGTLLASTKAGDKLEIHSHDTSSEEYFIWINTRRIQWEIYPLKGLVIKKDKENKSSHEQIYPFPKQSDLTGNVVSKILFDRACELSVYEDSKRIHIAFIQELNAFFSKELGYEVKECPIT